MPTGLSVNRLIRTSINLTPSGALAANINSLLMMGDSDVIDVSTRIESFADIDEVADRFGTSAAEYAGALLFFSQKPRPTQLYIGRWARTAVSGRLFGGALTTAQQVLSNFTAVTSGGFKIKVDGGTLTNVASINLSSAANLNAVASLLTTALTGASIAASVTWDGTRFIFKSTATGATSTVEPLQAPTSGTNLAPLLNGTLALGARQVDGIAAESALAAVTVMNGLSTFWYALTFACATFPDAAAYQAVAAYLEADDTHLFGITTQETGAIDAASTTDLPYLLEATGYTRTAIQYSSSSVYAIASALGRLITVNFLGNNTVITMMYKDEPTVVGETLTTAQANALDTKRCNYFTLYENGIYIFQNGVCTGDAFMDEIIGLDWLRNKVQTNVFNALYTPSTKIPQTDPGNNIILSAIEDALVQGRNNGLIAPGTWNSNGFGQIEEGQYLPKGYYIYAPPISAQDQADRAARKSVIFQIAVKLAGAIHTADIMIEVNR